MGSNALSRRRGYTTRPDVCAVPDNPGRCEPPGDEEPSPCDCKLIPPSYTGFMPDLIQFDVHFCRQMPPGQQDVELKYYALYDQFGGPPTGIDCHDVQAEFHPAFAGRFLAGVGVTWLADGFVCYPFAIVTVSEYEEKLYHG